MTAVLAPTPDADGVWRYRSRVTLDAVEAQQLRVAAESWWHLWEVGPEEVLSQLFDAHFASRIRNISRDISGAITARQAERGDTSNSFNWGNLGPSHAALERLRAQPAWVRCCLEKGCRWQTTVTDPAVTVVRCPEHRDRGNKPVE